MPVRFPSPSPSANPSPASARPIFRSSPAEPLATPWFKSLPCTVVGLHRHGQRHYRQWHPRSEPGGQRQHPRLRWQSPDAAKRAGQFPREQTFATVNNPSSVALADVNGDGKPDLLVGNSPPTSSNSYVSVFLGNGNGTFQAQQTFTTGDFPSFVDGGRRQWRR